MTPQETEDIPQAYGNVIARVTGDGRRKSRFSLTENLEYSQMTLYQLRHIMQPLNLEDLYDLSRDDLIQLAYMAKPKKKPSEYTTVMRIQSVILDWN